VRRRSRQAFTLIEMLVVVLFTAIVLTISTNFYLDLTRASQAALDKTIGLRRAATVLDRVARDLEAAVLVKTREGTDPNDQPWLFVAESSGIGEGADRLKFQARNHRPRAGRPHESDLAVVAYWLAPAEEGDSYDLLRWTSPRLPERLDRTFPRGDDDGVERLASGVADFGVELQSDAGAWTDRWDSSLVVESSQLPIGARIHLRFASAEEETEPETFASELPVYTRPVLIAQRPLDVDAVLEADTAKQDDQDDGDCVTVRECVSRNPEVFAAYGAEHGDFEGILQSIGDQCWKDNGSSLPVEVSDCD